MMRESFVQMGLVSVALVLCHPQPARASTGMPETKSTFTEAPPQIPETKPNILLIVADDLGYGDLSAYGGRDFTTPNLDALANDGMRFTAGYVAAPVCGPSRAGLLTGRHPCRILPFEGNPPPGSHEGLPLDHMTIADHLKAAGYRTAALGKWHLGETERHHPMSRGFDEFFGFLSGMHSYTKPEDLRWGPILRGREKTGLTQYLTFALADEACAFIKRPAPDPFFLYLAFNAPHTPLEAPEEYLSKTAHIADPMRRVCAAMILALDDAVGHIMHTLRESGKEDDTLVIFLSDNGAALIKGSAENGGSNAPLRGSKAQLWEGGIRVPFFAQWKGRIAPGGVADDPVSALDLMPTTLAAAGVATRPEWGIDGVNLLPWLHGKSPPPARDPLFWRFGATQFAVRDNDLKLVRADGTIGLFNVRQDVGEANDRIKLRPMLARQLESAWRAWDADNLLPTQTPRPKLPPPSGRGPQEPHPQTAPATKTPASFPNIVLILADDLGYGDVSCYNAEAKFKTPHIDQLATQGTRFTDAHSPTAVCTPTRYAILTGRYSWRTRLARGVLRAFDPPLIAPDRLTLPAMLKQLGYRTACIGKWHLGWDWGISQETRTLFAPEAKGKGGAQMTDAHRASWKAVFSRPISGGPTSRGFDSYFGPDVPNQPPYGFIRDDRLIQMPVAMKPHGDLTDVGNRTTTGGAGPIVEGWRFDQILPRLVSEAVAHVERRANEKSPFFLYLPLTSPHFPVVPSEKFRGRSGVGDLADFIIETDDAVGQVVRALDRSGLADKTLLIFTSDNGPADNSRDPLRQAGHQGAGPLRGHKGSVYEGGHRVPFVVRWPGHVPPCTICEEPITQACLLATTAELFGVPLPPNAAEDSFSILPLLHGKTPRTPTHPIIIHDGGASVLAIRQGQSKLVFRPDGGNELYDLKADIGEKHNLASARVATVAELTALAQQAIANGRTALGAPQTNDRPVLLRTPNSPLNE